MTYQITLNKEQLDLIDKLLDKYQLELLMRGNKAKLTEREVENFKLANGLIGYLNTFTNKHKTE